MTLESTAAAQLFFGVSVFRAVLQDFPEVAGVIAGMDDPIDSPWRVEVRMTPDPLPSFFVFHDDLPDRSVVAVSQNTPALFPPRPKSSNYDDVNTTPYCPCAKVR